MPEFTQGRTRSSSSRRASRAKDIALKNRSACAIVVIGWSNSLGSGGGGGGMGTKRSLSGWDAGESTFQGYLPESGGTTSRQPAMHDPFQVTGATSACSLPRQIQPQTGQQTDFTPVPFAASRLCGFSPPFRSGTDRKS
jgi:hypothetical protein